VKYISNKAHIMVLSLCSWMEIGKISLFYTYVYLHTTYMHRNTSLIKTAATDNTR